MTPLALIPVELGNNGVVAAVDIVDKIAISEESSDVVCRPRRGVGKKRQHAEKGEEKVRRPETAYPVNPGAHPRLIHAL